MRFDDEEDVYVASFPPVPVSNGPRSQRRQPENLDTGPRRHITGGYGGEEEHEDERDNSFSSRDKQEDSDEFIEYQDHPDNEDPNFLLL